MARSNITATWQAFGPVAADEFFQCHSGHLLVTFETGTDDERGIRLEEGDGLIVKTGKSGWVRRRTGGVAVLSREVIG